MTRNRKFGEATPLYYQIAEDLRYKILSEVWKVGQKIPPEMELCDTYFVSRITIRKAIDELVRENLLYRKRAQGTFVKEWEEAKDEHFTFVKSFTNEMSELGKTAATTKVTLEIIPADKKLSKYLSLNLNDKVMLLKRLRGTTDFTFAYFVNAVPYREEYSMEAKDYYGSFYTYLSQFGITVNHAKEYIEAVLPSAEVQEALKIDKYTPVLKRVRMMRNSDATYREYSECFYIGDQYRYYIDFS